MNGNPGSENQRAYLAMSSVLNLYRNEDPAMMSISYFWRRFVMLSMTSYIILCYITCTVNFTSSDTRYTQLIESIPQLCTSQHVKSCTTKYQVGKIPEWILLGHENSILTAYLMKRKIPIVYIFIYKHINLSVLFELDSQRRGGVRIEGNLQGIRDSPSSQSWIMNS